MKLTRLAATAASAILAMALSSTSWASCVNPGVYLCLSGVVHREAAPNQCTKFSIQPSEGKPVEFALQYGKADLADLIGKLGMLTEGAMISVLYTGSPSGCSGDGLLADGPMRAINFPPLP